MIWAVKLTPCYPNSWKVYPKHTYQERNYTHLYFPTQKQAQTQADKLNQAEKR